MEYTDRYKQVWTRDDENGCRVMEDRVLPEETKKIINDFKALILRFERVTMGINICGDGTKETEEAGKEQQTKAGYEKKTITESKTVTKPVEVIDRKTICKDDILSFKNTHGGYWQVIDIWQNSKGINCYTYEILGSEKRGYQRLKNAKRYYQTESQITKSIENGNIKIHTMQTVTESIEVEKWIKIDKSTKTYNTTKNTVQQEDQKEEIKENENKKENTLNHEITITADVDTRNNSPLWVVKLVNHVSYEEFKRIEKDIMNPIKGYYSRFKKGFIFKYDPTSILKPEAEQTTEKGTETTEKGTETEINYNDTAENIVDMSTQFITELNITGLDISNNEEYKTKLYDYIKNNNITITADIISYLKAEEGYNNLIEILELIQSGYYHPIKDGFIYDCHFKEWDIPMQDIQKSIITLNIPFIDWGEKIGFKSITAEQARQVKGISDKNQSVFFIDNEEKAKFQKVYAGTININKKCNSIEIKFEVEPDAESTKELKQSGFRYSDIGKVWYSLNTNKNLLTACTITGNTIETYKEAI